MAATLSILRSLFPSLFLSKAKWTTWSSFAEVIPCHPWNTWTSFDCRLFASPCQQWHKSLIGERIKKNLIAFWTVLEGEAQLAKNLEVVASFTTDWWTHGHDTSVFIQEICLFRNKFGFLVHAEASLIPFSRDTVPPRILAYIRRFFESGIRPAIP